VLTDVGSGSVAPVRRVEKLTLESRSPDVCITASRLSASGIPVGRRAATGHVCFALIRSSPAEPVAGNWRQTV